MTIHWHEITERKKVITIPLADLPERAEPTEYEREHLVRFGGVTPAQRRHMDEDERKAAARRHEEIALEHLAAARWIMEEYVVTPKPKYREVYETHTVQIRGPEFLTPDGYHAALRDLSLLHEAFHNPRHTLRWFDPEEENWVYEFKAESCTRELVTDSS